MRGWIAAATLSLLTAVGCQNADLLRPPVQKESEERGFTPIGAAERAPLTNDVAIRRLGEIRDAAGQDRLDRVETFLIEFPEARYIPELHQLGGAAELAVGRPDRAAEAFERALVLTRTDLLGVPLETELPVQVATAKQAAGDSAGALPLLARVSVVEESPRVQQALAWAWGESATADTFDAWLTGVRDAYLIRAPTFTLPGLQGEAVTLSPAPATIVNFWSPT